MVLAIDHGVEAREVAECKTGRRHGRFLAPEPGGVPAQVHVLPLHQVCEDVFDRPAAPRYTRAGHITRAQKRERGVQGRTLSLDLRQQGTFAKTLAHANIVSAVGPGTLGTNPPSNRP